MAKGIIVCRCGRKGHRGRRKSYANDLQSSLGEYRLLGGNMRDSNEDDLAAAARGVGGAGVGAGDGDDVAAGLPGGLQEGEAAAVGLVAEPGDGVAVGVAGA